MDFKLSLLIIVLFLFTSCAQVPKESVELSATVGRDLIAVNQSHRELAQLLFARMKHDINRFIDDVYAPYQIKVVMERQWQLANSTDQAERKKSLLLAINSAFKPDASPQLQDSVLKGMGSLVQKIHDDIEEMRNEMLDPINAQEKEVLDSIDKAYLQLHYANSIVTGHLSSVVKVSETQNDLLNQINIQKDLQKKVSENLSNTTDKISNLVETAEKADVKVSNVIESAQKIKDVLKKIDKGSSK